MKLFSKQIIMLISCLFLNIFQSSYDLNACQPGPLTEQTACTLVTVFVAAAATARAYHNNASGDVKERALVAIVDINHRALHYITEEKNLERQLETLFQSDKIAAIILKIDADSGSNGLAKDIFDLIIKLKRSYKKPVIAWVKQQAIAEGYHVAAAADYIIASEKALIGGVGTVEGNPLHTKQAELLTYTYQQSLDPLQAFATNIAEFTRYSCRQQLQFVVDIATQNAYFTSTSLFKTLGHILTATQASHNNLVHSVGGWTMVKEFARELIGDENKEAIFYNPAHVALNRKQRNLELQRV
jgi:ClpP class serine protease